MRELENNVATYKLRSERAEAALKDAERCIELLNRELEQSRLSLASGRHPKNLNIKATNDAERRDLARKEETFEVVYLRFADLEVRARSVFGRAGWRSALAYHLNISIGVMSAWGKVGVVPAAFVAKLERMNEVERQPASRQPWTPDEHQALRDLLDAGQTNLEIARTLSREFNRQLYEGSVVNQRRRLRIQEELAMRRSSEKPPDLVHGAEDRGAQARRERMS
ncbi:hypothetical protein ACRBEV_01785 [Methylobacterium phyllosphaerae]